MGLRGWHALLLVLHANLFHKKPSSWTVSKTQLIPDKAPKPTSPCSQEIHVSLPKTAARPTLQSFYIDELTDYGVFAAYLMRLDSCVGVG